MEIKNEQQYHATKKQIKHLEEALTATEQGLRRSSGIAPDVQALFISSLKAQMEELRVHVRDFEALRSASRFSFNSVVELGRSFLKTRIARGLTQNELATRTGLTQQSIQQYESRLYEQVTLKTLCQVAAALEIDLRGELILSTATVQPTIIIVDDEASACKAIESYFSRLAPDWKIFIAHSLTQVKALLEHVSPTLVITDLVMQNSARAGIDTAELVHEHCPGATVVILTGNVEVLDADLAERAGVAKIIDKFDTSPLSPCDRLFQIAQEVIALQ